MKHYDESNNVEVGSTMCGGLCYCTKQGRGITCFLIWLPIVVIAGIVLAIVINAALVQDPYVRADLFPGGSGSSVSLELSEADVAAQAQRLADAIAIRTISYSQGNYSAKELAAINEHIENTYPELHSAEYVTHDRVNKYSRLYRIEGLLPTANPYLLSAHFDVVPAGDLSKWAHDPFDAGVVSSSDQDGGEKYVFGRGAVDHKQAVFGILEALNYMAKRGQRSQRTLYVAFGHDEEILGNEGAEEIALLLKKSLDEHGEELDFILEEGIGVVRDAMEGVEKPLALIGVAEKGYVSVELTVDVGEQGRDSPNFLQFFYLFSIFFLNSF
jgi:carboxypeptidase PM20D1